MKALNPEWYNWGPIAELSGSLDERMFKYLRSLEYRGSVDDMLYEYLLDQGLTGSLSDMLYDFSQSEQFDIYVDSENGDDSNDGLGKSTAVASLSAITLAEGMKIGLARGSYWREQLDTGSFNNITIMAYGEGAMPTLDAADVIEGTWTQPDAENSPNVWTQTVNHSVSSGQYLSLWRNGERMFPVSSLEDLDTPPEVEGAAGYYYVATSSGSSADFYIYSEADPNEDGAVYEASVRDYGLAVGTNSFVQGIHTKRNGHNDGSLILGTNSEAEGCLAEDGVKHNALAAPGAVFRNCIAWKSDWPTRDQYSAFVGYTGNGSGLTVTFEGNVVVIQDHIFDWSLDNAGLPVGILAHTNGEAGENWGEVVCRRNSISGAITGIEVTNTDLFTDEANRIEGCRYGIASTAEEWNSTDTWVYETDGRAVIRALARNGLGVVAIEGARIFLRRGHQSGGAIYMPGSEFWSVTRSIIYRDGTGADGFCILVGNENGTPAGEVTQNILYGVSGGGNGCLVYNADSVVEDNVYFNTAIQLRGSSATYLEWSEYEAGETVRDQNSVCVDPLVNDPANGDFSLDPNSPAIALGASLERTDIVYTSIPSTEELEAL